MLLPKGKKVTAKLSGRCYSLLFVTAVTSRVHRGVFCHPKDAWSKTSDEEI